MPIYEYQCTKCLKIEEHIHKVDAIMISLCEDCSGKMNKIMSTSKIYPNGKQKDWS